MNNVWRCCSCCAINIAIKRSILIVVATVISEHISDIKLKIVQKDIIIKMVFKQFIAKSGIDICIFPYKGIPIAKIIIT